MRTNIFQSKNVKQRCQGVFPDFVVSGLGAVLDAKPNESFDLTVIRQPTVDGSRPEYSYKEDNVVPAAYTAISKTAKNPELAAGDFSITAIPMPDICSITSE